MLLMTDYLQKLPFHQVEPFPQELPQPGGAVNLKRNKRRSLQDFDLRKIIRNMGFKATSQRLLILKTLYSGLTHVTAQEVYELVSKKDPSVGFATIYRFLRALTKAGIITEVRVGRASARYELKQEGHHDHLTCTQCGKICEFENLQIEELQRRIARSFGFELTGHVMELYGICPDCQQRESLSLSKGPRS